MSNKYTKSKKSTHDIAKITKRSMTDFGERQTIKYMTGLEDCLTTLAENPGQGRSFRNTASNRTYMYYGYVSHTVYYRQRKSDIFIIRILHKRMLPEKHIGN